MRSLHFYGSFIFMPSERILYKSLKKTLHKTDLHIIVQNKNYSPTTHLELLVPYWLHDHMVRR